MDEKHRQAAIELIEWLQDHPSSDIMERVAEVSQRLRMVEREATLAEADRWASPPLSASSPPCIWETA